ncbi:ATP-dependent Clp protease adapter ClpS [Nigerium massiliense]|uniref:ATP-dependent Clp protease adapter ClpS n=1 Tax=Nigerium massiliense TaxID=1522317 RepID=UPI00058DEC20|nr:ATP-dependent Clp protease adapter ClpS [Nigerium massiliense]
MAFPQTPGAPAGSTAVAERPAEQALTPWVTLVWDDPVNLMTYVTHVFVTYFHYPKGKAERLMMQVHTQGKAVVNSGTREEMERDVAALQGYGLWATLERSE